MKNEEKVGSRSIYIPAMVLVIFSIIFSALVGAKDVFYYTLMPAVAVFVFGKFVAGMMFSQGWKTFKRKMILGLPIVLFIFYVIVMGLLVALTIANQEVQEATFQNNINIFLINAWAGIFASLIAWFAGLKAWMAPGSEYLARKEFQEKGYSQEEIESKISSLKERKLIS